MPDHFPPFRGRVSVTLAEIADQRKKGWVDFHPESFCHRCGGRNFAWAIESDVWNPVMRPYGPDSPWQWNEIICPACFAELFERKWPLTAYFLALDPNTIGAKAFAGGEAPADDMDRLIADPETHFAEKRAEAEKALSDESAGRAVRL